MVTENRKEMGYGGVRWINVAYDQIQKWVLQTG